MLQCDWKVSPLLANFMATECKVVARTGMLCVAWTSSEVVGVTLASRGMMEVAAVRTMMLAGALRTRGGRARSDRQARCRRRPVLWKV